MADVLDVVVVASMMVLTFVMILWIVLCLGLELGLKFVRSRSPEWRSNAAVVLGSAVAGLVLVGALAGGGHDDCDTQVASAVKDLADLTGKPAGDVDEAIDEFC